MALSSTEAKYMEASTADCEAWLRKMLEGLFGLEIGANSDSL